LIDRLIVAGHDVSGVQLTAVEFTHHMQEQANGRRLVDQSYKTCKFCFMSGNL